MNTTPFISQLRLMAMMLTFVSLTGGLGCASKNAPNTDYPTAARLAEIAKSPAPPLKQTRAPEVERLELVGSLPDVAVGAPLLLDTPLQIWLQKAADGKGIRLTANARCLAHQNGQYLTQHKSTFPGSRASAFISERCGEITGPTTLNSFGWETGAKDFSDDELIEKANKQLSAFVNAGHPQGTSLGMTLIRHDEAATFVVATTAPTVVVDAFPMRPTNEVVTIEGAVLEPFIQLSADVTQGEFGAASCTFDPAVAMPKFRLTCKVVSTDSFARIAMYGAREDDFFSNRVFSAVVLPKEGEEARVYEQKTISLGGNLEPRSPRAFLAAVNTVRGQAGLKPMSLAPEQSVTAASLAQHAGARQDKAEQRSIYNEIFKGMYAGWDLEEGFIIESASAFVEVIGRGKDGLRAVDLLGAAMESPSSRMALMRPDSRRLAIGMKVASDESVLSGLVGVYDPFLDGDYDEGSQDALIARVNRVRKARGLPPHQMNRDFQRAAERAARRARSGSSSETAMNGMLNEANVHSVVGVVGFVASAQTGPDIVIPEMFLVGPARRMGIAVQFVRLDGTRWGKTTAFFVTDNSEGGMVATREPPAVPTVASAADR